MNARVVRLFWNRRTLIAALVIGAIVVLTSDVRAGGSRISRLLRKGPGVSNHPVGVMPSDAIRLPKGWPLDARGAITCLTCHEKLPEPGAIHLRGGASRSDDPTSFCAQCHASNNPNNAGSMHWMALGKAHISGDATSESLGSLDGESRRCMACHDGVSAQEFNNSTPWNRGKGAVGDHRRDHPVGVTYPNRGKGSLRHASLLPKEVRLPGGRVSCVSCHDLYGQQDNLLTVPIEESKLCMTCHEM